MRRPTIAVFLSCLLLAGAFATAAASPSPARALIEKSIAWHDPGGVWWASTRTIALRQPRAEGAEQRSTFVLFPDARRFQLRVDEDGMAVVGRLDGDSCSIRPAGEDIEASRRRFEKMDCARMRLYRAYYGYLFNAPMNLLDDSAHVAPGVIDTTFMGQAVRAVRVTYAEGQPVWEHYFDPSTGAMIGCRFTRDPEWKSGEYIVMSGETRVDGIRLPRERAWHYNENGKWLGTDVIEAMDLTPAPAAGGTE